MIYKYEDCPSLNDATKSEILRRFRYKIPWRISSHISLPPPSPRGIIHPGLFLCLFTPKRTSVSLLHGQAIRRTTSRWRASKVCLRLIFSPKLIGVYVLKQWFPPLGLIKALCARQCRWGKAGFGQCCIQLGFLVSPGLSGEPSLRALRWGLELLCQQGDKRLCRIIQCEDKGIQSVFERSDGYKVLPFQTYKAVCLIPLVYRVIPVLASAGVAGRVIEWKKDVSIKKHPFYW